MVYDAVPGSNGVPVKYARGATNASDKSLRKSGEAIEAMGTLLVKYVEALKNVALGSNVTPLYRTGTVTGSNSTVSPNANDTTFADDRVGEGMIRSARTVCVIPSGYGFIAVAAARVGVPVKIRVREGSVGTNPEFCSTPRESVIPSPFRSVGQV